MFPVAMNSVFFFTTITAAYHNVVGATSVELGGEFGGEAYYTSTTNVKYFSQFAKDVKDMKEAASTQNFDVVEDIYTNGANVFPLDATGQPDIGKPVSLKSLSTKSTSYMEDDVKFNMYKLTFDKIAKDYDEDGLFDGQLPELYADSIVKDLFTLDEDSNASYEAAADASIAMNLWMEIAHMLELAVLSCEESFNDQNNGQRSASYVDIAAAYWIGSDVIAGVDNGYLLYNLAEEMGEKFGQISGEGGAGISKVNRLMRDHLKRAKEVAFSCIIERNSFTKLRRLKEKILRLMTIPLIQAFIHNMILGDAMRTELYLLSILPNILGCNLSNFEFFMNKFITRPYQVEVRDIAISKLHEAYGMCFGIKCDDVGVYENDSKNSDCADQSNNFLGYLTDTEDDLPQQASRIDLDIYQFQQLISIGSLAAAFNLFKYGQNSYRMVGKDLYYLMGYQMNSLDDYAIDKSRKIVPLLHKTYSDFFSNDDYAQYDVIRLLDDAGYYSVFSFDTRAYMGAKFCQLMIMFMESLSFLQQAIIECNSGADTRIKIWDKAAVSIIGSMESSNCNGAEICHGRLMYSVLKDVCGSFGTCHYAGNSGTAGSIVRLLIEGQREIREKKCDLVKITVKHITSMLLVALFQNAFHLTYEMRTVEMRTWSQIGSWYVSILSILPLISRVDPTLASDMFTKIKIIHSSSFDMFHTDLGIESMVEDLKKVARKLEGLDCAAIGTHVHHGGFCDETDNGSDETEDNNYAAIDAGLGTGSSDGGYNDDGDNTFSFFGIYTATTNVTQALKVAHKIRDMRDESITLSTRRTIYTDDTNSPNVQSLEELSIYANDTMMDEYMFNLYRHGFQSLTGDNEKFDGEQIERYADAVVKDLLDLNQLDLAAEAVVVFNVWMYTIHLLEESVGQCKLSTNTTDFTSFAVHYWDLGMALWIGETNESGGYLMYSLSESVKSYFERNPGDRSKVNQAILDEMSKAKKNILENGLCNDLSNVGNDGIDPGWVILRRHKNRIISMMIVPFVQNLIHHIVERDDDKIIELYSLAVMPLISACNPDNAQFITDKAIRGKYLPTFEPTFIRKLQETYSCLGITCEDVGPYNGKTVIPQCSDQISFSDKYSPGRNVNAVAKIDLDIFQMSLMMKLGAEEAVKDIYLNGYNSIVGDAYYLSLGEYSKDNYTILGEEYEENLIFYGAGNWLLSEMLYAIDGNVYYYSLTYTERAVVIAKMSQHIIMYLQPLRDMHQCIGACDSNEICVEWDSVAAKLIGSLERFDHGQLLYRLMVERCNEFDTCFLVDSLLSQLTSGQKNVNTLSCDALRENVAKLESILKATLIQDLIHYVYIMDTSSSPSPGDNVSAFVAVKSVLPLINPVSPELVSSLEKSTLNPNKPSFDAEQVIRDLKVVVPKLSLDCEHVGKHEKYGNFCMDALTSKPDEGEVAVNSTFIGIYTTSSDVENIKEFAWKVRDMKSSETADAARAKYKEMIKGYDQSMSLASLENLSLEGSHEMLQDREFNLFRNGISLLENDDVNFDGGYIENYADTIVRDLLDLDEIALAADATVVFNIWMYIVHLLDVVVAGCKRSFMSTASSDFITDSVISLDIAAALWVGAVDTDNTPSLLLYGLAQKMNALFGNSSAEVSQVNIEILTKMNTIKRTYLLSGQCNSLRSEEWLQVRQLKNEIVSKMTIPLVQSLFHSMVQNDDSAVEMHALSLVPLISACSPSTAKYIVGKSVVETFEPSYKDELVNKVQSMYHCLGISCEEVGEYNNNGIKIDVCGDKDLNMINLAGYIPVHDVREFSEIDLDIFQLKIVTKYGGSQLALDIFENGHNTKLTSEGYKSLHTLATEFSFADFDPFDEYFEGNDYVLHILEKILSNLSGDGLLFLDEKVLFVSKILQYMVMYIAPLNQMQISVRSCVSGRKDPTSYSWDVAAAYLIGSLEATGGSADVNGFSMYSALKDTCEFFDTCYYVGNSTTNDSDRESVVKLLEDGKKYAEALSCDNLTSLVERFQSILKATLIQNTIFYAKLVGDESLPSFAELNGIPGFKHQETQMNADLNGVSGLAAVLSVLPIVTKFAPDDTVNELLDYIDGVSGYQNVITAFQKAVPVMKGIHCVDVGRLQGYGNFCGGAELYTLAPTESPPMTLAPVSSPKTSSPNTSPKTLSPGSPVESPVPTRKPTHQPTSTLTIDLDCDANGFEDKYPFVNLCTSSFANYALDVQAMSRNSYSTEDALNVYTNGMSTTNSMSKLSTNSAELMMSEPVYNTYRFAFKDEPLITMEESYDFFADSIVRRAFRNDKRLGVEASVAIVMWQLVIHNLYDAARYCRLNDGASAESAIDTAFSLWVGSDQKKGYNEGWMLYGLTERASSLLSGDTGLPYEEANVNTNMIVLFQLARQLTGSARTCSSQDTNELRFALKRIVSLATVPLVQWLLYCIRTEDKKYVELFALATVPLVAGCDPIAFSRLRLYLIEHPYDSAHYEEVVELLQKSYNCLGITCDSVGTLDDVPNHTCEAENNIAGYLPNRSTKEFAKIDLDILQMKIFMELNATEAAVEVFDYGHNSFDDKSALSVSKMATNPSNDDARRLIRDVLRVSSPFDSLNAAQRIEAVTRMSMVAVSTHEAKRRLKGAVHYCNESSTIRSQKEWDLAATYLIGSLEGTERGGSPNGLLLFAFAKETCAKLNVCAGSGDAKINEVITDLLTEGSESARDGKCEKLTKVSEELSLLVIVPLLQGLLYSAIKLDEAAAAKSETAQVATAYVLSTEILQHTNDEKFKAFVNKNFVQPVSSGDPVMPDGAAHVFSSFKDIVGDLNINCKILGKSDKFGDLCPVINNNTTIDTSASTSLSNGLYITTTNVGDIHKIANDVDSMEKALLSNDESLARDIYQKGLNAFDYNESGERTNKLSLLSFSMTAGQTMRQNPVYATFRYALRDSKGTFLGNPVEVYADSLVETYFSPSHKTLAADAAVALNVWSAVTREVYTAVRECKENRKDGDAEHGGLRSLDRAVAFWIGDNQATGDANQGYLLYALAESMGEAFGQEVGGQSRVNRNILNLFNRAKDRVTFTNACTLRSDSHVRLKHVADEIVSVMTVPLLQSLVAALIDEDRDRVRLYAVSVVPMIAGCDEKAYTDLRETLIDTDYQSSNFSFVMSRISSSLSCLGLSCDDIKNYNGKNVDCKDPLTTKSLAGYVPISDVREQAKFDMDLRQIAIFLEMRAHDAAADHFVMGKNSKKGEDEWRTLQQFASDQNREVVPQYLYYRNYYDNYDYADKLVTDALLGVSPYNAGTNRQKAAVVNDALSYMVMHMHFLRKIYESLNLCYRGGTLGTSSSDPWDEAVAYYTGSSLPEDGLDDTLWGLARSLCDKFDVCDEDGEASINRRMYTLFYAGRSESRSLSCAAMQKTVDKIKYVVLVPLVQNSLRYALDNEKLSANSRDPSVAKGHVAALSLLPILNEVEEGAAIIVRRNFPYDLVKKPVPDGADAVFTAYKDAISKMPGFDCRWVGRASDNGATVCDGGLRLSSSSNEDRFTVAGIVLLVVANLGFCALAFVIGARIVKAKSLHEVETSQLLNENGVVA